MHLQNRRKNRKMNAKTKRGGPRACRAKTAVFRFLQLQSGRGRGIIEPENKYRQCMGWANSPYTYAGAIPPTQ
jgi:hypothetical protein